MEGQGVRHTTESTTGGAVAAAKQTRASGVVIGRAKSRIGRSKARSCREKRRQVSAALDWEL